MNNVKLFDCHFHIIDPHFPLINHSSYSPPFFTVKDYLQRTKHLGVVRGTVISASFQGFDQTFLIAALKELGPQFVGVTQLPLSVTDEEINQLNKAGVRGIRFNIKQGGSENISHLKTFSERVYKIAKWHTELYMDAKDLLDLTPILKTLPAISIDHLGLSKEGFKHLLPLIESGVKIKATGFGRVDFPIAPALKQITNINPDALMFGTDLPSTRAPRPFLDEDIQLIIETLGEGVSQKVLYQNALDFYIKV